MIACKDCRWSERVLSERSPYEAKLECRRRPPTSTTADRWIGRRGDFPNVRECDWCGEFERRDA